MGINQFFSLEDNSMTNDETQALLDDLQEEKRETVYPTQDVDQLFLNHLNFQILLQKIQFNQEI